MEYRPRVADAELVARLRATGAVLVEGPKGCGKTETARRSARSEVLLDVNDEAREAALLDPDLVLDGERPRLIDEWQLVPARGRDRLGIRVSPSRRRTGRPDQRSRPLTDHRRREVDEKLVACARWLMAAG